ncbi:MAG: helix-turn-helix domain-containing protein [Bacteroidales bacterium]|nr:helix-turn-helix domain-containing protein [Bacteroidales bacterium]
MKIFALIAIIIFAFHNTASADNERNFYTLNRHNGLSDNCIWQLLQLGDGRMVSVTPHSVDIFDGQGITTVDIDTSMYMTIPLYNGATHIFADRNQLLCIKQWQHLYCIDLKTLSQRKFDDWDSYDFYIDGNGETWLLKPGKLCAVNSNRILDLSKIDGVLQDVVSSDGQIFTFWDSGLLAVFDDDGNFAYQTAAYSGDSIRLYNKTSLVVCGPDTKLYQVRTGEGGSILMSFDADNRTWQQILSGSFMMHTLTLTPSNFIYITTSDGYIKIDAKTLALQQFSTLYLPDGTALSTGINTVCSDREGGIWLGTYNNGLLYSSPFSGLFDTQPLDIEVEPILTTVYMHGRPLQTGAEYDGRVLMEFAPPYIEKLIFKHSENSPAFQFSTMNYVRPRATFYRFRFSGGDNQEHILSADSSGNYVNDKGIFYFPLVALSPGSYTLEVAASTNPNNWQNAKIKTITFIIESPWWQTKIAYLFYALLLTAVGVVVIKKRHKKSEVPSAETAPEPEPTAQTPTTPEHTAQEKEFMAWATSLVEQHLSDSQYGVEQLAADLCMERTGLYKKLTAMIQQSPVAFIRSIRLHRAAAMIAQKERSISEISELTGFCSVSYFSKCFQKEFGCKPSEYGEGQHYDLRIYSCK